VEVSIGASAGTTADSRNRGTPVNSGAFTEERLLRDFVFSTFSGTNGLDLSVKFLAPNQVYNITVWSFDALVVAGNRISDWYVNGVLTVDDYTFVATNLPASNAQYQFTFPATSDANGQITIQARRDPAGAATASVYVNALRIALPVTRVSKVELVGGNVRLTVQTPDSSKVHGVDKTDSLSPISFGPVAGVASTILSPTSVQLEFAQPSDGTQFYRVVRAE